VNLSARDSPLKRFSVSPKGALVSLSTVMPATPDGVRALESLESARASEDPVRPSIGVADIDDIEADLDPARAAA
jgi:hypothetical protein